MSHIDKQSVRDKFDELKSTFNQLVADNKVPPECKVLFEGFMLLFTVVLAIFFEKSTKKTSKNSGIPPSQTEKDDSTLTTTGSKGKGLKQASSQASNTRTVESVEVIPVTTCPHCGGSLENTPCHCIERRTRIDIVFEKKVEHVDTEIKICPACKKRAKAPHPADMPGRLQYGNGVKAYAIHLLVAQMVPLNRVKKSLCVLLDQSLSESTLLRFIQKLHEKLAPWEEGMRQALLAKHSLHVDETSLRVDKKNYWIHSYSSENNVLKYLHKKRGKEAMEDINLIPNYTGILIHDCWGSYLSYQHCTHGLCGSHLLRELTFIITSNNYRWAKRMKRILKWACHQVAQSPYKRLTDLDYKRLACCYEHVLTLGEKELPVLPPKPKGKRGPLAKTDAHNLFDRFKKYKNAVLLFAMDPEVAFTNNRAERDLRMDKVKQKVSGCFRTKAYAEMYCRITSYLKTMAYQGINPMIAIMRALEDDFPPPEK